MEKMGWQKGKGLGANENGMTEHIKVRFKSDTKGIGFKNEYDNVWLNHQDEFENLLNNLSQNNEVTAEKTEKVDEVKSLEKRSKETKRLHYKKFAKSKDLSSVSADDLNCILGTQKRKMKSYQEPTKSSSSDTDDVDSFRPSFKQENSEKFENSSEEKLEEDFGIKFSTNKLSVQDYFANIMNKKKIGTKNTNGLDQDNLSEECGPKIVAQEEKSSKKKKKKTKDKEENKMQLTDEISENLEKEKINKKNTFHHQQSIELPISIEPKESEDNNSDAKTKKKKKKYKESIESEGYNISVNSEQTISAFDENLEQKNELAKESSKSSLNEENEYDQNVKKKKKKSNNEDENVSLKEDKTNAPSDLDSLVKSSFKGSNLLSIFGYSAYYINSNLEEMINEKVKRLNRKRYLINKKILIDAEYYKTNKKMNA